MYGRSFFKVVSVILLPIFCVNCTEKNLNKSSDVTDIEIMAEAFSSFSGDASVVFESKDLTEETWDYRLIFQATDIPLPSTNIEGNLGRVSAVYSPNVVYSKMYGYVMVFGVSITCQNGGVARDSIGWATSQDGVQFRWQGYLIEPDSYLCSMPISAWPQGTVFQVNDPAAILVPLTDGREILYLTYTEAVYRGSIGGEMDCGYIGLSIFEMGKGLRYQNRNYLKPNESFCRPGPGGWEGFSRPTFNRKTLASTELWFDVAGKLYKIPVSNLNQLDPQNIQNAGYSGAVDVDLHTIGNFNILFALGPVGIPFSYSYDYVASWTPIQYTGKNSEYWTRDLQGGGHFFLHPVDCSSKMYLSGVRLNPEKTGYVDVNPISIGVAIPAVGNFGKKLCRHLYGRYL